MKKKIYIAGPMRGIIYYNFYAFNTAAEKLKNDGWEPVNPAELDRGVGFDSSKLPIDTDWTQVPKQLGLKDIVKRDLDALYECDAIFMLKGWKNSTGACAEYSVAKWLCKEVFYEM